MSSSGAGEIQFKFVALKGKEFSEYGTALPIGGSGYKTIQAERIASQGASFAVPIVFRGVERQYIWRVGNRRLCFNYTPSQVMGAIEPCAGALWTRAKECLVPSIEMDSVSAAHEESLCQRMAITFPGNGPLLSVVWIGQRFHRRLVLPLYVACGESNEDVGSAVVGLNTVSVEMFVGRILVREIG